MIAVVFIFATPSSGQTRPGLFEQNVTWNSSSYSNVWEQVALNVTLTSPSNREIRIGGFYFAENTWKFRFAPNEPGRWFWHASIGDAVLSAVYDGQFDVDPSSVSYFVQPSRLNPFRWTLTNGSPFYPVGINDCVYNRKATVNEIDPDGPIRFWLDQQIVEKEQFFQTFGASGANLFRWGPDNCSVSLYDGIAPEGNRYRQQDGNRIDEMLKVAQSNNLRVFQVLFGFNPPYAQQTTADQMAAIKRYVKYMVDRYGALIDFWELMNEARASDAWYQHVSDYIRQVDPYQHPISTSFEYPAHPGIQVSSPHWYQSEPELQSDLVTAQNFAVWKASGKPVLVGEQGNTSQSWDPSSALRMRLRLWTAMFSEGSLTFWNSLRFFPEVQLPGDPANLYVGPEERGYIRVLQDFSASIPPDVASCLLTPPAGVRTYCLAGAQSFAIYLHHFENHSQLIGPFTLQLQVPQPGIITWMRPDTGETIQQRALVPGVQQVTAPAFVIDLAGKFVAN